MSSSVEVVILLTMLFLQGVLVNGDCENIIEDEHYGTNFSYEIKPEKQSASDTRVECRQFGGWVINTTNTELLSYIINAHGSSETSFWIDQYSTTPGSFPPSCRYYDVTTGLIVLGGFECYSSRHTICTYPPDGCIPIPAGTEHCPYGFVEKVNRNLCFAAILSRSTSDPCGDFGVTSIPVVYDSGDPEHIDLLKDVVDAFDYPDLMYNIKKEGGTCDVFHRDTEMITQTPCSEVENRVLCQHNMTYNGPCPVGGVYGGGYPPGKCYVITNEQSKDDLFETCPTGSYALKTSNLTLLKWIAASTNLEGESFFIAPLVVFAALYNDNSDEILYDLSNYQTLHPFICDQRAEAAPFASSENQTSGFSTTLPVQTTIITQQGSSELPSASTVRQPGTSTSTTPLQSESRTTLRGIYSSRAVTSTPTTYYYQSSADWQTSKDMDTSKDMGTKHGNHSTSHSSESSSTEFGTTTSNEWTTEGLTSQTNISSTKESSTKILDSSYYTNSTTNTQSNSVALSTDSHTSLEKQDVSERLKTTENQFVSDFQSPGSKHLANESLVNFQSNLMITENASIGYNQTGFTTFGK